MSDFKLFEKAYKDYCKTKDDIITPETKIECIHIIEMHKGVSVCTICGEENIQLGHIPGIDSYYKQSCSGINNDGRLQYRKTNEKSIWKDVESMGFSDSIIRKANKIYLDTTQDKIYRGNSRKGIICACIFEAYKTTDTPELLDTLIKKFNIPKKQILSGLKSITFNNKSSKRKVSYITPVNIIKSILKKLSASEKQISQVLNIYNNTKNKSSQLNRARPNSVAAGIVYYWIKTNNKQISIKQFSELVDLSEITINKIVHEINIIKNLEVKME